MRLIGVGAKHGNEDQISIAHRLRRSGISCTTAGGELLLIGRASVALGFLQNSSSIKNSSNEISRNKLAQTLMTLDQFLELPRS
jgi:hypothetical protein